MTSELQEFQNQVRQWLIDNCPPSMRQSATIGDLYYGGTRTKHAHPDGKKWLDMMIDKGWTAPEWPTAYGGGGLSSQQAKILEQEMKRLHCRPPLIGHGLWMLGPALLEFGTEAQKLKHLPKIARGEIRWCQGYSEPEAGSDLASLRCKAEDKGDYFLVNGSKTWTTDADKADWIFCLVRTDFTVKKQMGISFLLIDMRRPGITTRPIRLISGESHFCETFLDNVKVPKANLVGELDKGWTIAKILLLYERNMMSNLMAHIPKPSFTIRQLAKQYLDEAGDKKEAIALRDKFTQLEMDYQSLAITQKRITEELQAQQPSNAALLLKYAATELDKQREELVMDLLGNSALGWEGDAFEDYQLEATRHFLISKGLSIGGGTSEIQLNIIAKSVLGLPSQ